MRNGRKRYPERENVSEKGGCQETDISAPGMYYEKVFSKKRIIVLIRVSNCFHLIMLVYGEEMKKTCFKDERILKDK